MVALHDPRAGPVPADVAYLSSSHDSWRDAFQMLSDHAAIIVAFATSEALGPSFLDVLSILSARAVTDRPVVVLGQSTEAAAHVNKNAIFERLDWPVPAALPIVARCDDGGKVHASFSLGSNDSAADRYRNALRAVFGQIRAGQRRP